MESKGVPFFETAYGMEEEPLICNPKRTGIVHDWKNFSSKPNLSDPSWKIEQFQSLVLLLCPQSILGFIIVKNDFVWSSVY
jgi:hypothetical protein